MRFKKFLNEKLKKIDKNILNKVLNILAKKYKVNKKHLEYIGYTDLEPIEPGRKLLQFNILDPNHEKYRSTIAYEI